MRSRFLQFSKTSGALLAVASVAIITLALLPFRQYLNATEVALTLLLIVLFASSIFGSRAGLAASITGIVSFNFFFLQPYYTFNISGAENWVAFGAFLITALLAGQLSGYARRRAEESEARQQKIEALYDELRDAFEQASEAEALRRSETLKSALLDAVTHDLRTPLTSIKASVTTLLGDSDQTELDADSRREFLEIIDEETDRLNDFVEGIVGMAKLEAGSVELRASMSSIDEIIANAVDRARPQLVDHELEISVAADLPNILIDAASISQVVYTLLDNAAKYSPKGSTIRVSAISTSASKVRIIVEDQGRGIAKHDRENVFDKFFRIDKHADGAGLGLGLTIARGIIESQHGRIWIEDGSNEFTTRIVCELPTESERADSKAAAR